MRKILRFGALCAAFFALFGAAHAASEDTREAPVVTALGNPLTDLSSVNTGDYILIKEPERDRGGFLGVNNATDANQILYFKNVSLVNSDDSYLCLLEATKNSDGSFSLKLANNEYVGALPHNAALQSSAALESYVFSKVPRTNNRWFVSCKSNPRPRMSVKGDEAHTIIGWNNAGGKYAKLQVFKPTVRKKKIYRVICRYNFMDKMLNGTDEFWVSDGSAAPVPSFPSYISGTLDAHSPTTITAPATITYDCVQSQTDIPISRDLEHATWFGFKQRDNSLWVHADTASDGVLVNEDLPLTQEVLPYYTWAVVGNWIEGYKIYNQAKKDKPLTIEGNLANLKAGAGTTIELVYTDPQHNWNLRVLGTNKYVGDHLNIGHETDPNAHHLSIWNNARGLNDGGTNMNPVGQDQIQELVKETLKTQIQNVLDNTPVGILNGYKSKDEAVMLTKKYAALLENDPSLVDLNEMLLETLSQKHKLQVAPNKYYVFISKRNGKALSVSGMDDQLSIMADLRPDTVLNCPNAVVQFVPSSENGKYYLMTCGKYLGKATASVQPSLVADKAEAGLYEVLPTAPGNVAINNTNSTDTGNDRSALHCDGQFNVVGWAKGVEPSSWFVVPMDSLDVQLYPADGGTYATLCVPFKVTLPEGLKAYRLDRTNVGKSSFRMLETGSQTIAANTPVLLKGTAEKYVLAIDDDNEAGAISESNLFAGLNLAKSIDKTSVFVFGIDGTTPGFYRPNKTYLKANRAYFMAAGVPASTTGFSLDFGDGTTGISRTLKAGKNEGVYYDLQGRRVQHPVKGVYIKNGKKVVL